MKIKVPTRYVNFSKFACAIEHIEGKEHNTIGKLHSAVIYINKDFYGTGLSMRHLIAQYEILMAAAGLGNENRDADGFGEGKKVSIHERSDKWVDEEGRKKFKEAEMKYNAKLKEFFDAKEQGVYSEKMILESLELKKEELEAMNMPSSLMKNDGNSRINIVQAKKILQVLENRQSIIFAKMMACLEEILSSMNSKEEELDERIDEIQEMVRKDIDDFDIEKAKRLEEKKLVPSSSEKDILKAHKKALNTLNDLRALLNRAEAANKGRCKKHRVI